MNNWCSCRHSKRCVKPGDASLQTPHCDGLYRERYLFSTKTWKSLIRGQITKELGWIIPRGTIAGVLAESRFSIYREGFFDSEGQHKKLSMEEYYSGVLVATKVTDTWAKLEYISQASEFEAPNPFFATQISRYARFNVF